MDRWASDPTRTARTRAATMGRARAVHQVRSGTSGNMNRGPAKKPSKKYAK
jgi:hypothetical protein